MHLRNCVSRGISGEMGNLSTEDKKKAFREVRVKPLIGSLVAGSVILRTSWGEDVVSGGVRDWNSLSQIATRATARMPAVPGFAVPSAK